MAVITGLASLLSVTASWDTQPRVPTPTPNLNPSLKKNNSPKKIQLSTPQTTSTTIKKELISTSELLKLNSTNPTQKGKVDELHLGCERWLPVAPKVKKPRSIYNAASLAYLGDCIYELYARRHFLFPPLNIEEYNDRVMAVVRCEAQASFCTRIYCLTMCCNFQFRDILRWGKNIDSGKTKTTKRAGIAVYNRASSLETLVGYLYLTNVKRLEELMVKMGFSTGASKQPILEKTDSKSK
ncbi:Ribonuclease III domain [Macleaya cordata]|uniref:Ribonuclease III domain n=1 Tax=Macleaya cordata TaxID=56857 RepID=A0A200R0T5_MACCD|nr:Ribonuclease III domain [Macleaya cordata]